MTNDGWKAVVSIVAGALLLLAGTLIPAHFRRIDREVVALAGAGTPTLNREAGRAMAEDRIGAARLFLETAKELGVSSADADLERLDQLAERRPAVGHWGGPSPWLDRVIGSMVPDATGGPPAVLTWLLPEGTRQALLRNLQSSTHPATMALLGCTSLKDTKLLPPASSASGQPMEASLALSCVLVESARIHPTLMLEMERTAAAALRGEPSLPLESTLLELLAVARHLNWEQLATLMERCEDRYALRELVAAAGTEGAAWAPLVSAVVMNGGARDVAGFLAAHGEDGLADLKKAMSMGSGAVSALTRGGYRMADAKVRRWVMEKSGLGGLGGWLARVTGRAPLMALCVKYLLWVDGLFLLLTGLWYGRHLALAETNRRFEPRPDIQRLAAVTAAAAVVLFLAAERFLVLKSQGPGPGSSQTWPVFAARLEFDVPQVKTSDMNEKVIAMLVAFFVIQLAIYFVSLGRLRHIRGQAVEGSVKLRLLDNEESMFDAPLYIGIGGSVLGLLMRLTGYDEVSLMASYASTLFGILFCFVLKVMHVRPYRQRLILESAERKVA